VLELTKKEYRPMSLLGNLESKVVVDTLRNAEIARACAVLDDPLRKVLDREAELARIASGLDVSAKFREHAERLWAGTDAIKKFAQDIHQPVWRAASLAAANDSAIQRAAEIARTLEAPSAVREAAEMVRKFDMPSALRDAMGNFEKALALAAPAERYLNFDPPVIQPIRNPLKETNQRLKAVEKQAAATARGIVDLGDGLVHHSVAEELRRMAGGAGCQRWARQLTNSNALMRIPEGARIRTSSISPDLSIGRARALRSRNCWRRPPARRAITLNGAPQYRHGVCHSSSRTLSPKRFTCQRQPTQCQATPLGASSVSPL
jgi:hypothetical protein